MRASVASFPSRGHALMRRHVGETEQSLAHVEELAAQRAEAVKATLSGMEEKERLRFDALIGKTSELQARTWPLLPCAVSARR
jgi:hypothetical protein